MGRWTEMWTVKWSGLHWVALALLLAAAAVLYLLDPAKYAIYPVCLFHKTTGLLCPGCGGLRAAHQLLHGHLGAALRLNAVLILSLPLLGVLAVRYLYRRLQGQSAGFVIRPGWLWTALGLLILFGIARNLPLN